MPLWRRKGAVACTCRMRQCQHRAVACRRVDAAVAETTTASAAPRTEPQRLQQPVAPLVSHTALAPLTHPSRGTAPGQAKAALQLPAVHSQRQWPPCQICQALIHSDQCCRLCFRWSAMSSAALGSVRPKTSAASAVSASGTPGASGGCDILWIFGTFDCAGPAYTWMPCGLIVSSSLVHTLLLVFCVRTRTQRNRDPRAHCACFPLLLA